jgi:hypothetical protein
MKISSNLQYICTVTCLLNEKVKKKLPFIYCQVRHFPVKFVIYSSTCVYRTGTGTGRCLCTPPPRGSSPPTARRSSTACWTMPSGRMTGWRRRCSAQSSRIPVSSSVSLNTGKVSIVYREPEFLCYRKTRMHR